MKLSDYQYDQVAAYVRGELIGDVLLQFEAELERSELLRKEVQLYKTIANGLLLFKVEASLKDAKIENLLEGRAENPHFEVIKEKLQEAEINNGRLRKQMRRILIVTVVAACFLSYLGIKSWSPNYSKEVAGENIMQMPKFQEAEKNIAKSLEDAVAAFENGDKEAAYIELELVRTINSECDGDKFVTLCKGVFKAQEEKYEEAVPLLISAVENKITERDARRYLGSTYVLMGENRKAKQFLK